MIKSFIINTLKISKTILCYFFIFFLFKINDSYAFVGGASMGGGGGASSAGSPSIKSGISIVDPEGKSFNCEPFVDKKWESTSSENSWNGVYFSLGYEASKFSGDFKIESSIAPTFIGYNYGTLSNDDIDAKKNSSGSSSIPIITIGGGFLIDRMYLATDMEIRPLPMELSAGKIKINEQKGSFSSQPKPSEVGFEKNLLYTFNNYVMFNAKIGYLLSNRSMVYFNAGIGSLVSMDLKFKEKGDYAIKANDLGDAPPPIRLSVGSEYLLSNHFRLTADYSYWIVPQYSGTFEIIKDSNSSNNSSPPGSQSNYIANLKINSLKIGILYRF